MQPKKDGCPRCTRRDNEPKTWDETTGHATYRCRCGHAWECWWETPGSGKKPVLLGDLADEFLSLLPARPAALSARNPKEN